MFDETRLIHNKIDEVAIKEGCYFDAKAAEKACNFFERYLCLPDDRWRGTPFHLQDWQKYDVVAPLFGWKNADGSNRFRRGYLSTAKKNSKTTTSAALVLYKLLSTPAAEIYSAANTKEQAATLYRQAALIVKASPKIKSLLKTYDTTKTIADPHGNSFYRVLSSDSDNVDGLNANLVLMDELHRAKHSAMYDVLRYSCDAKSDSLFLILTTAGCNRNSICYEQYCYAKKVRDNLLATPDISYFTYVREAAPEDDWEQESTWRKANPSLGTIIDLGKFRQDFQEAKESPIRELNFRRLKLNQWVDSDAKFIDLAKWERCVAAIDPKELIGRTCTAGLDIATRIDIAALTLCFPQYANDKLIRYDFLPFFFMPRENADKKERKLSVPIRQWAKQGLITLTEGNSIDQNVIRQTINSLASKYQIAAVAYDRWQAVKLVQELDEDGLNLIDFGQGFKSMSAPTKELEALILDQKINHFSNPVLKWMAGNVCVETDSAGNVKMSRKRSKDKIDGMVSLVMSLAIAQLASESVYESRGIEYY